MSVKDDLHALCSLEARIAALTDRKDQLRRSLLDVALDQLEAQGAAPTWRTPLGSVGLTVSKPKPTVVDNAAFEAFVEGRYGEEAFETITTRRLRAAAFDALVAECQYAESVGALITSDGEHVPGMTAQAKPPYLFVRLTKEAKLGAAVDLAAEHTWAAIADAETAIEEAS